VKTDGFL